MKITMIVEGKTEKAFLPHLRNFLETRLHGKMPNIDALPYNGRIPTDEKLERVVDTLLRGKNPSDHVIALTDVYTGSNPPEFPDAATAKSKMQQWVGKEPRFHPHVALYDFEAWLLPYWDSILDLAKYKAKCPSKNPETVNHNNPPAHRLREIFANGEGRSYVKPRDANRILSKNDLSVAIAACPELKLLVNTIISLCNGVVIP